ncbi:MAG TPA: 16S rRNA (cytosine(1402)-N(4))-methyltransferase RsmH [Bacteroidia bacterium]|nr:16S rRNA (cytosine(1402)-N(4))-methyltransferase RsmH [Bacteroidia bacterium]
MSEYHVPVMLAECLEGLNIKPNGTYVDVTYGGGGHSRAILEKLGKKGRLVAFDQDTDAINNKADDDRLLLVNHNFRYLKNFLKFHKAIPADGLLADLGISSYQIDEPEKGFAHRWDAPLDMRMDQNATQTAADIVNTYTERELTTLFKEYGELDNAYKLAKAIVSERTKQPIATTGQLKQAVLRMLPRDAENKYLSQIFQALRIEVNKELEALKHLLKQSIDVISKGGRLVIMSYHSLEDRMVKNFIKTGNIEGREDKDLYGNITRPFKGLGSKAITASEEEIARNPRARSAKLRIAERV